MKIESILVRILLYHQDYWDKQQNFIDYSVTYCIEIVHRAFIQLLGYRFQVISIFLMYLLKLTLIELK